MPKPKKNSADWYIATTHFLTAGFAIPLLGGLAFAYINALIFPQDGVLIRVAAFSEGVALVYFGVMYAAAYVNKTYVIRDARRIVTLSTTYYIVLGVVFFAVPLLLLSKSGSIPAPDLFVAISSIIGVAVFYFASKKYIRAGQ